MAGYLSLPSFSTATTTNATRCRAFNGLSSTSSSLIAYPRCPGLLKGVKLSQSSSLSAVAADVSASTDSPRKKVYFDEEEESEEEVRKGYEALYGPAFSGIRTREKVRRRGRGEERDPFQERVVQIRRVTKVVKGGKQLSFRAIVIVGDKRGRVGVGVGSAKEVVTAVQKSAADARRHVINVPMTKYRTFPHRADGKFGAALVMLRPAATGTGVIAGGSVRVVLEMAGIENALGKEIGSKNASNNARAVLDAVSKMKQFSDVARDRGIPMEELWK